LTLFIGGWNLSFIVSGASDYKQYIKQSINQSLCDHLQRWFRDSKRTTDWIKSTHKSQSIFQPFSPTDIGDSTNACSVTQSLKLSNVERV